MPQVKVSHIKGHNFRSFQNIELEFPKSGLVLLKGPSGAGKTNVIHLLTCAFECCAFPATELQTWLNNIPFEVTYTLETGEGVATLVKGKKTSLQINDEKFSGSEAVASKLHQLTGYQDPKILQALVYREQKRPGLFLSKPDADKKGFLMGLLGLDKFEQEIELAHKRVTTKKQELDTIQGVLDVVSGQLEQVRPPEPPTPTDIEPLLGQVTGLSSQVDALNTALNILKSDKVNSEQQEKNIIAQINANYQGVLTELEVELKKHDGILVEVDETRYNQLVVEVNQANKALSTVKTQDNLRKKEVENKRNSLDSKIQEVDRRLSVLGNLANERKRLQVESDKLKASICPTCERTWEKAANKLIELSTKIAEIENSLIAIPKLNELLDELQKARENCMFTPSLEIAELESILREVTNKMVAEKQRLSTAKASAQSEIQKVIAEYKAQYQEKRGDRDREISAIIQDANRPVTVIGKLINDNQHETNNLAQQVLLFKEKVKMIEKGNVDSQKSYEDQVLRYSNFAAQVEAKQNELHSVKKTYNEEIDWHGLVKGYLANIFDEVLNEISYETNSILSRISNTAHCTLYFKSENETQKGKVQKKIVPIVTIGGHEANYKSGCSGGQISSIELAVDLAVGRVIQRRTGSIPGFIIFDECFEGFDIDTRESALEILKEYAEDRLVLVVDHASELKEAFTEIIEIGIKDGKSYLV